MRYGSITHEEDFIEDQILMSPWAIASILSTAFAYGCTYSLFIGCSCHIYIHILLNKYRNVCILLFEKNKVP